MNNKCIGVTERGDAGIDLSWTNQLSAVDGAVIISKRIVNPAFRDALLKNSGKVILHAGITGNGGTVYEPNVPSYTDSLNALQDLIDRGFPRSHIVFRCDPIIPDKEGLTNMHLMFNEFLKRNMGITRIRVSVLDNYRHVQERFSLAKIQPLYDGRFQAGPAQFLDIARRLSYIFRAHPEIEIESCAEPLLQKAEERLSGRRIQSIGCVSMKDAEILHIDLPKNQGVNPQNRKGCLCISAKKELLSSPRPCPHKCLYCYWRNK